MADFSVDVTQFWTGSARPVSGSTSFGYFDNDPEFQQSAPRIANHIAGQLGYPVNDIEITDKEIYDCIELAMMKYSYLINEFRTEEEYFDLLGQPSGSDYSNQLIFPSIKHIIRLSEGYNIEAGVPKTIKMYTGSIDVQKNKQNYDLKAEYFDVNHPQEFGFSIQRVFHSRIPAARSFLNSQFNYPINGVGNVTVADGYFYTLMPFGWDVSRMQSINTHRDLRLSNYAFEIQGNNIRLYPRPTDPMKLYFHYTLASEENGNLPDNQYNTIYNQNDVIVKPSDIKFGMIPWKLINTHYRTWVIEYSTAVAKKKLGINRRKFNTINLPNDSVTLDGDSLVSEASTKMDALEQDLKESLSKISKDQGMTTKANMLQNQKQILNGVPLGIYRV